MAKTPQGHPVQNHSQQALQRQPLQNQQLDRFQKSMRLKAASDQLRNNELWEWRDAYLVQFLAALEVVSFLLVVQVGLFTQGLFMLVPVLLLVALGKCLHNANVDYQTLLRNPIYLMFPKKYSALGLYDNQKPVWGFYGLTILVRLSCAVAVVASWADQTGHFKCAGSHTVLSYGSDSCSEVPGFLQKACSQQFFEPSAYQRCLESRSWSKENYCNWQAAICFPTDGTFFSVCSKVALMLLSLAPSLCFTLFLVISLFLMFLFQSGLQKSCGLQLKAGMLGSKPEAKELRRKVGNQETVLKQQFEANSGTLDDKSLVPFSVMFPLSLLLVFFDVGSDVNLLVTFLSGQHYGFAAAQLAILCVSVKLQVDEAGDFQSLWTEVSRSWGAKVETDKLLKILKSERLFEAPASFLLAFYSCFFTNAETWAMLSCCVSILTSVYTMATAVFKDIHLGVDLD